MLDIALAVSILLTLTNVGDLILRASQRQAFQNGVETAVLWLDYRRPLNLLPRLPELPAWTIGVSSCVGGIIGISGLCEAQSRPAIAASLGLVVTSLFLVSAIPVWHRTAEIVEIMKPENGPLQFSARALGVVCGTVAVSVIMRVIYESQPLAVLFSLALTAFALARKWRWFIVYHAAAPICVAALAASSAVLVTHALVRTLLFLGWRAVDYPKGAWAALMLLIATAIGVARLLIK